MKERDKTDWLEKISLAGNLKTPFLLTDLGVVVQKVKDFKALMPRVGIYYAVKSNSDPHIIRALSPYVDGFDIASSGELQLMNELEVEPTRLIYSHPMKVPKHIHEAFKSGITYFAFDSLCEIEKLKMYAPGSITYLRLKVADYGSKFPLSGKFGVNPEHARVLAEMAAKAGLRVKGLAFHVGSQAENTQVWSAAFKISSRLIEELKLAGINIDFLDIGGGFPALYEDLVPTIEGTALAVNDAIDTYIPDGMRVFAEPGRYVSANACVIGSTIIGRENRNGTDWLYLDMGVFQGLMEPLEVSGWKYPVFTENTKSHQGYEKSFVLAGPTCDGCDTLGMDYLLPSNVEVGEKLYFAATGAYSLVYASNFNGFEVPALHYFTKEGSLQNSVELAKNCSTASLTPRLKKHLHVGQMATSN